MSVRYLHKALFPDSIAVLGAGDREPPLAGTVLGNIVSGGYKGRLCTAGVETDIPGLPAYPTAESVPGPIDLAIVAAAHGRLPETLHACGKIRAAAAVIVSEGNYPSALGKEILGVAKSAGVRLIGPHAWGLVNPLAGLNAGFGAEAPPPGELAVISQSSAICASIIDISLERSIGLGFLVGPGDMVDVDFADIIDYAANSSRIKAILLHVERIANLRRFLSACRAASRIKPIIVLKTDRHRFARSFAEPRPQERLSEISIYDAALKRTGIIRVESVEGLFDCAGLIGRQARPGGPNLVVITNSKSPGVMAADALNDFGLAPARLGRGTIESIDSILPPGWSRTNPISTRSQVPPETFARLATICLSAKETDGILLILSPQFIADPAGTAACLGRVLAQKRVPVLVAWMGGRRVSPGRRVLDDAGIPTYDTPERAVKAFMVLLSYDRSLKLCAQVPPGETRRHAANQSRVRSIMAAAAAGKGTSLCLLPEPDALDILKAYDISTLPNETAGTDARLMLGCRLTHDFGPVIFMGPGGRLAGMFRDWAIGLPPLNRTLAAQMIESAPTLTRYLEAHGCDAKAGLRACEDTIIKVSGLATDFPDIAALDINPLILAQGHAFAVSAGISLRPSKTVAPLHLVFSPYPGRYEQSLTTRSGLALLVRPIKPEDAHLLRDLWAVFSPQTIYYRFSRYLRELSPEMLAGLTQIDYDREIALAALNPSDAGEKMLAVARLYGEPGDKAAEFSVVVGDPWQGKGIGALLLERLVAIARDRKIKSVWGLIQRENTTMIELARSLDFTITGDPGDPEVEAFLRVG